MFATNIHSNGIDKVKEITNSERAVASTNNNSLKSGSLFTYGGVGVKKNLLVLEETDVQTKEGLPYAENLDDFVDASAVFSGGVIVKKNLYVKNYILNLEYIAWYINSINIDGNEYTNNQNTTYLYYKTYNDNVEFLTPYITIYSDKVIGGNDLYIYYDITDKLTFDNILSIVLLSPTIIYNYEIQHINNNVILNTYHNKGLLKIDFGKKMCEVSNYWYNSSHDLINYIPELASFTGYRKIILNNSYILKTEINDTYVSGVKTTTGYIKNVLISSPNITYNYNASNKVLQMIYAGDVTVVTGSQTTGLIPLLYSEIWHNSLSEVISRPTDLTDFTGTQEITVKYKNSEVIYTSLTNSYNIGVITTTSYYANDECLAASTNTTYSSASYDITYTPNSKLGIFEVLVVSGTITILNSIYIIDVVETDTTKYFLYFYSDIGKSISIPNITLSSQDYLNLVISKSNISLIHD